MIRADWTVVNDLVKQPKGCSLNDRFCKSSSKALLVVPP